MMRIPEKYFWPGMVIAILSLSVVANIILVTAALSDGGPQVIDNYYEKSVKWDESQAEIKRIEEIGWTVDILVGSDAPNRVVRFVVRDRAGSPVEGLAPHAVVHSPAKIDAVGETNLTHVGQGVYTGEFALPHAGFWDFEFKARAGETDFLTTKRIEVLP